MDQKINVFRVFIASPNDLADERRALHEGVERINAICSKETDWRIELLGWEEKIVGEDRPVVESQRPEELPLDLAEELHVQSDRMTIAYRKELTKLAA